MTVLVRRPVADEKEAWKGLFVDYLEFYRSALSDAIIEHTWRCIHDEGSSIDAFVAEAEGKLVGLTHYVFHASTWDDRPSCYLEDLYVAPSARGSRTARELIAAVEGAARGANAFQLYWLTQQYNGPARSLYDTITPPSSFIVYQKTLA